MRILVPNLRTYNVTNVRMHWRARNAKTQEARDAVTEALYEQDWTIPAPSEARPWDVHLVRLAPRELDDDGVVSALKGVRDAVAAFVGVDDKHRRLVRYTYDQRPQPEYGVEITVRQRASLS
jgi:hypothetical protein